MAETLAKLDSKVYRNKMIDRNGKKILYEKTQKGVYGTLCAALLFWNDITEKLGGQHRMGFTSNPYNAWTMNKVINGSQAYVV